MKKFEKIFIGVVLSLSIISMGIMNLKTENQNGIIVIQVDNREEKKISLSDVKDGEIYAFNFKNTIGYIEVNNGKVRMLEMTKEICPNAICSETGWIQSTNQSIVCLPNKIVVKIEGVKADKGIDEIDIII